ncbi:hypothetical protein GWI33_005316 [Rhynchophorus ferrugineus]|uniref:Uncharacterized protein n=1 Tax=Rhynchophorus ferrugineus TaxID=354439 RepID=A0A834MMS9_RHYFE|nr:hypothetical protein GWI33_005316 [Rhynchophorus ferrugineus]
MCGIGVSLDFQQQLRNNRSTTVDDSRRFSCGSIVSRRATMNGLKRNEIPVETIYSQNKVETLQWQMKEIEKSREMYKAVMKQVVTFLEKAHVSLENLGNRLNRKHSVPRSRSEHHIVADNTANQRSLIEEHVNSWSGNKKDQYPDEIPPEKLSQEAFRLLRTAQSLINAQEPNLIVVENDETEPSDIEFLAQLAKEFPSDSVKPHRPTSISLTPKLILPEQDIKISTAFNRKLSLQLNDTKNASPNTKFSRCDSARGSATESEYLSLSGVEKLEKNDEKATTPPTAGSISSIEDESGFSSMTSFQDVGIPLVNSTAIEEVSPRSLFLKSILNEQENDTKDETLLASSFSEQSNQKRSEYTRKEAHLQDVKLWQKPINPTPTSVSQLNYKRWSSNPDQNINKSLRVLWV